MGRAREMHRRNMLLIFGGILILTASLTLFYVRLRLERTVFEQDGWLYDIENKENGEGREATLTKYVFAAGTSYTGKYPDKAVFADAEGNTCALNMYSFVYYSDGSAGSFMGGVLVNLDAYKTDSVMESYYLPERTMLGAAGSGYALSHNGKMLEFRDGIWKEDGKHFLVLSSKLVLIFPGGEQEDLGSKLEIRYLEQGVVQLAAGERAWQMIADGSSVHFAEGYDLDLGSGDLTDSSGKTLMNLADMDEDMTGIIRVKGTDAWSPPTYNFTVIDGKDGEDGETGEIGEEGETGQTGETGEAGEEGSAGESGDSGTAGAAGNMGASIIQFDRESEVYYAAQATLAEWNVSGTTLTGRFTIDPKDMLLSNIILQIVNENGTVLQDSSLQDLFQGGYLYLSENELDDELIDVEFHFENLAEDSQYTLKMSAVYSFEDAEDQGGTSLLFSRDFYTSSLGISVGLDYLTSDSIYMSVKRSEESSVSQLSMEIYEADGTTLVDSISRNLQAGTNSAALGEGQLNSNTDYVVKVMAGNRMLGTYQYKTLKKTPRVGDITVSGKGDKLNMQVYDVQDEDNAILRYIYRIYDNSDTLVKSITTTSSGQISAVVDEETIFYNMEYRMQALVQYADNEKTAEFTTELSESVTLYRANEIMITYAPGSGTGVVGSRELLGEFTIDPGEIEITYSASSPIYLEITANAGAYRETQTIIYEPARRPASIRDGKYIIPLVMTDDTGNTSIYKMPGTLAETTYQFNFYGIYFDEDILLEDPYAEPVYGLLGSYTITTDQ